MTMPSLLSKIKNKFRKDNNNNKSHYKKSLDSCKDSNKSTSVVTSASATNSASTSKSKKKGLFFKSRNKNDNQNINAVTEAVPSTAIGKKVGSISIIEEKENQNIIVDKLKRSQSPNSTSSPPFFDALEDEEEKEMVVNSGAWNLIVDSNNTKSNRMIDREKMVQRSLIDLDSSFEDDSNNRIDNNMVQFEEEYEFQPYRNYQLDVVEKDDDLFRNDPIMDVDNKNPPRELLPSPTESTDFCLSTDVEDDEYNKIRNNAAALQNNALLRSNSPTSENSSQISENEPYGLFPSLPQENPKVKITPMAHETEDDLRAWTPSPRHSHNNNKKLFSFDEDQTNNRILRNDAPAVFIEPSTCDSDFESIGAPLAGEALLATSVESNGSFENNRLPFSGVALADGLSPSSTTDKEPSPLTSPSNVFHQQTFFNEANWTNNDKNPPEKPNITKLPPSLTDCKKHSNPVKDQIPHHPRHNSSNNSNAQPPQVTTARHRPTNSAPNILIPNTATPSIHASAKDTNSVSVTSKQDSKTKRKKRRSKSTQQSQHSDNSSSNEDMIQDQENWLFDEVTGALGPRGITADLESLGGRSGRSKTSTGNKSHRSSKSHRSHRSHKSHKSTSSRRSTRSTRRSRHHNHHDPTSGESVGSRNSHISHRSSRSHLSHMTEASRSVANDLLRLEMQLAMVGGNASVNQITNPNLTETTNNSVGGNSRSSYTSNHNQYYATSNNSVSNASRTTSSRKSSHRTSSTATNTSHSSTHSSHHKRTKISIIAPPGKLGIILANKFDTKGTVISGVRSSSVLIHKLHPGDRLISVDGEDVSRMTVAEITTIMARKNDFERTLVVLTANNPHHKHLGEPGMPKDGSLPVFVRN